jgi:glutamyl aminopeptidase
MPLWESDYRIPQDTQASHYDLYLHPDLDNDTFSGKVTVHIIALAQRDFFVVHSKYHAITSTVLRNFRGDVIESDAFAYEPNEFWVVTPKSGAVSAGKYTLTMEFNGSLTEYGILGLYKSVYTDADGNQRAIATSKFQPTHARKAFPHFDEPSFKSTFNTTLVRPSGDGYIALSNMPELKSVVDAPVAGKTEVTFEKSVPMVSYLAVFVVCDFEYLEKNTPIYDIPFR